MADALSIVKRFFPAVEEVSDATKDSFVEVTKRDTSSAKVKNHEACAMAVACKRKFELDGVIISVSTAYLVKGRKATRYQLPQSVRREIVSFDRHGDFSMGEYKLHAVAESNKIGSRQGSLKDKRTNNGSPKKFRHMTEGIRTVLGGRKAAS